MYGQQQLQAYLRHHIALAQYFAQLVQQDARFEVAAPQRFGLVCFRLAGAPREANVQLLEAVNASGRCSVRSTGGWGAACRGCVGPAVGLQRVACNAGQCSQCLQRSRLPHGLASVLREASGERRLLSSTALLLAAERLLLPRPARPAGQAFLIHTELGGQYTLRLAVGAATTQKRHIDQAWQLLSEAATQVLAN
jgi:glutamate/tyrosine decarboxylase-like PLP-dependent enzyme